MDWKEALTEVIAVAPKLAFKQELIDSLAQSQKAASPPNVLISQVDVLLAIAKQNQRLADLYGYATLEAYAKRLEIACTNLLSALRQAGLGSNKPQMNV